MSSSSSLSLATARASIKNVSSSQQSIHSYFFFITQFLFFQFSSSSLVIMFGVCWFVVRLLLVVDQVHSSEERMIIGSPGARFVGFSSPFFFFYLLKLKKFFVVFLTCENVRACIDLVAIYLAAVMTVICFAAQLYPVVTNFWMLVAVTWA